MPQYALEIKQLNKVYPNGFAALHDVSLNVPQGAFYALLGPNGAGKSTTIGVLCSLIPITQGEVWVFGVNLQQNPSQAKQYLGVVPQEFNFGMFETVWDILIQQAGYYGIGKTEASQRAEHYLRKLGLWDKRKSVSRTLSGGMKRRLMIARALMHNPKILILDEPTAGVDIELRRSMWDFLSEINQQDGVTIILTTHYLEEAEQLCKRIAIIDKGRIVKDTDMKTLLSQLNFETFVLDLTEPQASRQALEHQGATYKWLDAQTIELTIQKGTSLNQALQPLNNANLQLASMRNKTNRLEELFMHLVERNLD